ncbi:MAG TPA: DUF2076 domain-containing protein [Acetobacteraceae bacterium]|nr:DUF2076 domain-containing protein [Acetobacteraceae bacterium]
MTPQEQDIIGRFIARVGGAAAPGAFGGASVPATQQSLPPVDPEADRFIADQFSTHPEARYRITQLAFVQEAALAEAQNRMKQMEYQLNQANQQLQQLQSQGTGQSRGFFGNLFGGASPQQSQPQYAPPPPQYAPPPTASYPPSYQPGMFRSGGSGFLGSALTTAAGVAGGVLAADAISSMFSPHGFGGGGFGGGGFGGGGWGGPGEVVNETVVNNYGDAGSGGGDPWAGGGATDPGAGGGDPWSGGGAQDSSFSDTPQDDAWSGGGDSGGDSGWDSSGSDDSNF